MVSFDLEWTKNYKIKYGNEPFCFSFVFINNELNDSEPNEKIEFSFIAYYIDIKAEIPKLVKEADKLLEEFFAKKSIIVGHQLSSDISIAKVTGEKHSQHLDNISKLKHYWHIRKTPNLDNVRVFDTRYDIGHLLKGKSRRLVDVSFECNLDVSQPEISSSMTKMQNAYYETQDKSIMEKLLVMNIRHSLSAALLYMIGYNNKKPDNVINVNNILYNNLKKHFGYINTDLFYKLLS